MASTHRNRTVWSIAAAVALTAAPATAATCPFDTGASDALNDGLVLARYALGITGSPLTASTRYASLDPLQVKSNIECVGCALDMNGDGQIDAVDTTVIARHLAGFKGESITNGLILGAGSRSTTAAVTSFLANGCAVGGAISAFTQGGNAFGAPAVLGTTDGQALMLGIGGGTGVRIIPSTTTGEPNIIGGHADSGVSSTAVKGAFVGGGGATGGAPNSILANYGVIVGGAGNKVHGNYGALGGGAANQAGGNLSVLPYTTVGGGLQNSALGEASVVAGGRQNSVYSTGSYSAVGGGRNNIASGSQATIGGGDSNAAEGLNSTVPGGFGNTANGESSFAAGQYAYAAARTFVWNSYNSNNNLPTRTDSFRVQAANGFDVSFGPARNYFVAFNADTASFIITTSTGAALSTGGVWTNNSDRAKKRDFSPINAQNAKDILRKVVALPLSTWSYFAEDAKIRHIGPMAQDFWRAFGFGYDDKTMTDIDARGVTLAAIQGLNQIVKDRDGEIAQLKSRLAAIERQLGLK